MRVAVSASMVVKSGRIRVGQKQMDKFSLVIRFRRLFRLTLRGKDENKVSKFARICRICLRDRSSFHLFR